VHESSRECKAPPSLRPGSAGFLCSDAEDANNLPSPSRSHARTLAASRRLDPRLWNPEPSWRATENKNPAEAGLVCGMESFEVSSVPSFFLQTGYRFCNRPFAVVPRTIALVLGLAVAHIGFSIGCGCVWGAGEPLWKSF
jgi:hypothetical protein